MIGATTSVFIVRNVMSAWLINVIFVLFFFGTLFLHYNTSFSNVSTYLLIRDTFISSFRFTTSWTSWSTSPALSWSTFLHSKIWWPEAALWSNFTSIIILRDSISSHIILPFTLFLTLLIDLKLFRFSATNMHSTSPSSISNWYSMTWRWLLIR